MYKNQKIYATRKIPLIISARSRKREQKTIHPQRSTYPPPLHLSLDSYDRSFLLPPPKATLILFRVIPFFSFSFSFFFLPSRVIERVVDLSLSLSLSPRSIRGYCVVETGFIDHAGDTREIGEGVSARVGAPSTPIYRYLPPDKE